MINNRDFLWNVAEFFMSDVDIFLSHTRIGRHIGEHTREGMQGSIVVDISQGEYTNVNTLAHELTHEGQLQRDLERPYDEEDFIGTGKLSMDKHNSHPREQEAKYWGDTIADSVIYDYCRYGKAYRKHLKQQVIADMQDLNSTKRVFIEEMKNDG